MPRIESAVDRAIPAILQLADQYRDGLIHRDDFEFWTMVEVLRYAQQFAEATK